jgi:hypothetical protein
MDIFQEISDDDLRREDFEKIDHIDLDGKAYDSSWNEYRDEFGQLVIVPDHLRDQFNVIDRIGL